MNIRNVLQALFLFLFFKKGEDHNIQPVGLGSTRILMDYAKKSPRTPCGFD
jgi:hypothetical protein